ncbi:hypothetical protein [Pontixanthobacter aquaemixtae]|uniref:Uncharacterized protein n=1 Tax=Pontixanthobacter aquaemixtae TaxID=1958940 RepID=A0A844ZUZ0_9SPHN|nr:hypothetical protein [Pontixanthobacter aquaemixtae]MXO90960.1 hypothetical protein [Pontixanthobacter aquaemixtae]
MKKAMLAIAAFTLPTAANASLDIQTAWDKNCSKPGSMAIKATNNYKYAIDMRLCLKRTTGKWTCYVSPNVKPGETAPKSWGYYVCNATGDYFWSTRRAGAWSVKFDDPPGYQRPSSNSSPSKQPAKKTGLDIKTAWDKVGRNTLSIKATNNYGYAVDLRLCVQRKTKKWLCYVSLDVKNGQTAPETWGYYADNASGEYFWSVRRAGSSAKFDDPPGYKNN